MAEFWPFLVKEKNVLGVPIINPLFRRVLKERSNLRESGHLESFLKQKLLGNKSKHSLTNLSKAQVFLFEITE